MNSKGQMTQADASRIQSHADRTGTNQDFKSRAQSSADSHAHQSQTSKGGSHGASHGGGSHGKSGGSGGKK